MEWIQSNNFEYVEVKIGGWGFCLLCNEHYKP